jgi:SNF2 family DNA or RNA helicase
MSAIKKDFAFCLHPENIILQENIFSILEISRTKTSTSFKNFILNEDSLVNIKYNKYEFEYFNVFTEEHHKFRKSELTKFFKKQKSGANIDAYLQKAYFREIVENLQKLIQYSQNQKLYHRIKNPNTGNFLIRSCTFSDSKPKLEFNIIKNVKNKFYLDVVFIIDSNTYSQEQIIRHAFTIEIANQYYLLSIEDCYVLDWIQKETKHNLDFEEQYFIKNFIKKLEIHYTIHNKSLFTRKIIDTQPKNCIYLSEVNSGAFLMLTPQWKYDDILVDGDFVANQESVINGEIYLIKRNQELENEFVAYIKQQHQNFSKQLNKYFYLSIDEAKKKNWFLKLYHELLEKDIEIIGIDMLGNFRYSAHQIETKFEQIKTIDNIVEAQMQISFGKEKISLLEMQKTIQNNQKNILLKDNTIGIIPDDWIETYALILKHSRIDKDKIIIPKWLLLQQEEIKNIAQLKFVIHDDWWQKWQSWQQIDAEVYPIPKSIQANLRPYQKKGYEWLCLLAEVNAGACLADDMGLGKTLQTICFLAYQLEKNPLDKFLIVCPSSLMYNWKNELEKFLPHVSTFMYYGNNRNFDEYLNTNANIMLVPYSTARADVAFIKNMLWNTIVLDESHNIKTLYAQTTKAIYQIFAKHKIALSGTPIMNNTFDLYAQLNYLLPNFLGTQEFFRQEYVLPIDRNKNEEKTQALQKLTAPFILRRTKQQVATDLPEKTELTLWCTMKAEQQEVYEKIRAQIKQSIFLNIKNDGLAKSKLNILQGIIKLRQVCCSPALLNQEEVDSKESIKIDVLIDEITNNLSNNKVLIFSQFKGMLHLIAEKLQAHQIAYFHFDGDTKIEDRQEMVAKFQTEGNPESVFLMSLKTGNAGINLTAADYVFLVDPWWNTAIQQQAIDRTHRIGQTKNVFAYKMICKNTIEEKIIAIQQRKQMTSDALIVAEENFVKNLSQDDIAFLFD